MDDGQRNIHEHEKGGLAFFPTYWSGIMILYCHDMCIYNGIMRIIEHFG